MGILDGTLGRFGYQKQQPKVEAKGSGGIEGAFGGNNWSSMGFSTFNGKKQQIESYNDWVYIAARTVAEQCASIDLRVFKNHSKLKSLAMANKLMENPAAAQKYLKQRKNVIEYDAQTKQYIYRKDVPALEELETHPLLDLLNCPNQFMTKNEFFEVTFLHLELTGNAYWAILERGKNNEPTLLFPLLPNQMSIVPDKDKFISGYVYRVNGTDIPFSVDDIIHHKYANPADMREGYSAVQAGARAIDTDAHMAEWNRKTMYNDARISGFLTTDTTLDDKTFKRIKTEFNDTYSGTANAYKVALLEGGMDFKQMSLSPKDMDFQAAREFNRDQIFAFFGVPKSLVGYDESMSRANAETAEYVFTKGRIKPKMQRLTNRITEDLAKQFKDNVIISFTDPVPEDKEFLLKETQSALGVGGTLPWAVINEERAKRGDAAIEGGDELFIPGTFKPVGDVLNPPTPADTTPAAAEEDPNKPADNDSSDDDTGNEDDTNSSNGNDNDNNQGGTGGDSSSNSSSADTSGSTGSAETNDGGSAKSLNAELRTFPKSLFSEAATSTNPKVPHKTANEDDLAAVDDVDATPMLHSYGKLDSYFRARQQAVKRYELVLQRGSREVLQQQKQEVVTLINTGYKGQQYTTLNKQQQKAALGELFDKIRSIDAWKRLLIPTYKLASKTAMKMSMDIINNPEKYGYIDNDTKAADAPYDPWASDVQEYFTNRAGTISKYFDTETDKQLRATLSEGTKAGEDRQQLLDRVEKTYGGAMGYRADRIARTESQSALNYAAHKRWEATGLIAEYIWITSATPCPICMNMQHHVAKHAKDFAIGAPPAHPNCACEAVPYKFKSGETIGNIKPIYSTPPKKPAPAPSTPAPVEKIDLTENSAFLDKYSVDEVSKMELEAYGGNNDPLLGEIYKANGDNALPEVVDKKVFDAEAAKTKNPVVYRGLTEKDPNAPTSYTNQLKTGEYFPGKGIYGNGTYSTTIYKTSLEDYTMSSNPEAVTKMVLKDDAKIIDAQTNQTNQIAYRARLRAKLDTATAANDAALKQQIDTTKKLLAITRDPGRYAAMKGYDALYMKLDAFEQLEAERYYVVFNRGALVIQQQAA